MQKYVQAARRDHIVIEAAKQMAARWTRMVEKMSAENGDPFSAHDDKLIQLEAIDIWCREYFCYVEDPDGIELIQTPRRMYKQTRVPQEVLEGIMRPFFKAMERADPSFHRGDYPTPPLFIGDCDEAATMVLGLCSALRLGPLAFRFGGNNGMLHHVWAQVYANGEWWDSDVTEPGYELGDFTKFDHYESLEIPA